MTNRWLGCFVLCAMLAVSTTAHAITGPTTLPFADRRAAAGSQDRSLQVTNPTAAAVPLSATITGPNAGDFEIVTNHASVPASGAVDYSIRFDPDAPGMRAATLTIVGDTTLTVALTGLATAAQISVGSVDLGAVRTGTTATGNMVVFNPSAGPGNLTLTGAAIEAPTAAWFTVTPPAGAVIAPGGTSNVTVRCAPPVGMTGPASATVRVTSDADLPPMDQTGTVSCTGVQPTLVVSTTTVAFGDVAAGATAMRTVTVSNPGSATLTYNVSAIAAPFTFSGGCTQSCTVNPGASRTFTIQFAPTDVLQSDALVMLTSDDPLLASVPITVSGRGTGPKIAPGMASLAIGNVDLNQTRTGTITVRNTGNTDLTITAAALLAGSDPAYTVTPPSAMQTLQPNDVASWTVTCRPTTIGLKTGTFRVSSNALNTPELNVPLTCTGIEGRLASVSTTIAFGGVPISTLSTIQVSVTNPGNTAVTGVTATIAPSGVGYSVTPAGPVTIPAGGAQTFLVTFAPTVTTDGGAATLTVMGMWGTNRPATLTIPITGTAQNSGFELNPAAGIDFGNVPYTATATASMCAVNSNPANLAISGVALEDLQPGSELVILEYKAGNAACVPSGNPLPTPSPANPVPLAMGESLVITVRWNPRAWAGALVGTLRVSSNAPTATSRTAPIRGTSTTGTIQVSDGALIDFGPVDVQAGGATRQVTLSNAGLAPLSIVGVSMPTDPQFQVFIPGSVSLDPGAQMSFDVKFTPLMAAAVGSETTASITLMLAGDVGMTMQRIDLRGRGTDRQMMVDATPVFPDTFINAGSLGSVQEIIVRNAGEAPLRIAAVMLPNPSWSLVDPAQQSFEVAGLGQQAVAVRFSPASEGLNEGTLIFTTDDAEGTTPPFTGMVSVQLRGTGRQRGVGFAAGPRDVGLAGTNFAVELEDFIVVKNDDPVNAFTIRELEIAQSGRAFTFTEDPRGVTLAPLEARPFTVRFAPTDAERFEYTGEVVLYLDENPIPQSQTLITGQAVFVDARGGGGCSTTGSGGGAALWFVGLAALVLRRRRRRTAALVALVIATGSSAAVAEDVVLSSFDPTPETQPTNFQVQSGLVGAAGDWVASAALSYATDPLVQVSIGAGGMLEQAVIDRSAQLQIGGAYAFLDRWEVGARLPLYSQSGDLGRTGGGLFAVEPVTGRATGDLVLHAKARLLRRALAGDGFAAIAGGAQLTLPTATDGAFTGVEYPSGKLLVLASLMPGAFANRVTLSANAGAVLRATSEYANLEQRSGVAFGLGLQIRAFDRVWVAGETYGTWMPSGRSDAMGSAVALTPMEWLAGVKVRPDHRLTVGLAAGRGLTSAAGSPALRGVLALTFTPYAERLKPIHPPPPPRVDGDEDMDGLRDSQDRCPNEAEDVDAFEDDDGCPELDNDRDGVPDLKDKCPLDEEDIDKFDDLDGCPELDNDQDGIPDLADECGTAAEDKDKFQDEDGCPDPDNDQDGILDVVDKCPLKPEVVNGRSDDDGCPDQGESLVVLSSDKLELMESIAFARDTAKFTGKSTNVLGQIGATLRAHPEILKVRVTCHVHPSGNDQKDQALSELRANAARDWLVKWGIAGTRLDTRGFGSKKPLVKSGRNAPQLNDRVELIILERQ